MNIDFSPKQKISAEWWKMPGYSELDAVICDGSIRSGKTLSISYGFVKWAFSAFNGKFFAFCGKTINSVRRNILYTLTALLKDEGFEITRRISENYIDIKYNDIENRFFVFGGKDETSADLIQGVTLAGVLFDEVVLMPKSFVQQAIARCSFRDSKIWFSCNPDNPGHWFYNEWIKNPVYKKALYLHFTLDDNPALDEKVKERYKRQYSGVFYRRFIKGEWVAAEGIIYPMFSEKTHVLPVGAMPCAYDRYYISADYGTINPTSFGLWGRADGIWYRINEYYFNSRKTGYSRTDEEHYQRLEMLAGERNIEAVIIDPSAASMAECIRRHGRFRVLHAENDVVAGIRRTADFLLKKKLMFSEKCVDIIREFNLYSWQEKTAHDMPVKENDHAMDDMRYFVNTVLVRENAGESYYVHAQSRYFM